MARKKKSQQKPAPQRGWAIYLRTSDKDVQNPENSQRRQRDAIKRALLRESDLPVYKEYIDNMSGSSANNRDAYQQMLADGRAGKFSHVAVENAERFGRNDTEALRAIDELHELGVAVRFADYPDLDPMDPDDRIVISLSFSLARRESLKLGQRVRGGMAAMRRNGRYIGYAPDGYLHCEERVNESNKHENARYHRWIKPDPERRVILRTAWDMLLTDRWTLAEICEALHLQGYTYRSGRPFVEIKNGKRKANYNRLSEIFHNPTYAGLIWLDEEGSDQPPHYITGNWEPLVTREEYEQGLAILEHRSRQPQAKRRHFYLLKGLVCLAADAHDPLQPGTKLYKLQGSTSNPSRPNEGQKHYRLQDYAIHIAVAIVEEQVLTYLHRITVDEALLPRIRAYYQQDVECQISNPQPDQRLRIEQQLKDLDGEEALMLRQLRKGRLTEAIYEQQWQEIEDQRRQLRASMDQLGERCERYLAGLDDALEIMAQLGILYGSLPRREQYDLLRQVLKRVVIDHTGLIMWVELLPPFAYLRDVNGQMQDEAAGVGKATGGVAAACSSYDLGCSPNGTRTRVSALKGQRPGPLDDGALHGT